MKTKHLLSVLLLVFILCVSILTSCTEPCEHAYIEGICDKCGEADENYTPPCVHPTYTEGACTTCGTPCAHPTYTEGACATCGTPCAHPTYTEGACATCGTPCAHENMTDDVCQDCGYQTPVVIPADKGASLYHEMIEAYKALILYKLVNEELPPKPQNPKYYTDAIYAVGMAYDPTMEVGYAMKDIDNDGYLELLLMGRESRLYAMFTIAENTPKVVIVFQNGMGYLAPDGTIFYNDQVTVEKTTTSTRYISRLCDGVLVGITYGWTDTDGSLDTDEDTIYFVTDEKGVQTTVEKTGKYKEYGDTYAYYWDYSTRLTKLSELVFIPALPSTIVEVPKADFSTYEAIIHTFGLMHSTVAGGRFVRSSWVAGAYDMGMTFDSEADFHLYNKLLSAAVLVQNSSTASFGYILVDLDKNGTDELILMESKYYVLAIFTMQNGKPVLLRPAYLRD